MPSTICSGYAMRCCRFRFAFVVVVVAAVVVILLFTDHCRSHQGVYLGHAAPFSVVVFVASGHLPRFRLPELPSSRTRTGRIPAAFAAVAGRLLLRPWSLLSGLAPLLHSPSSSPRARASVGSAVLGENHRRSVRPFHLVVVLILRPSLRQSNGKICPGLLLLLLPGFLCDSLGLLLSLPIFFSKIRDGGIF